MTTTPTVIRDGIDPMIVTTKFDVDHEHDAESGVITHADVTAALYVQHGDSAMKMDFGVFGDPDAEYLEQEYNQEIEALDALIAHLEMTKAYLTAEFAAVMSR